MFVALITVEKKISNQHLTKLKQKHLLKHTPYLQTQFAFHSKQNNQEKAGMDIFLCPPAHATAYSSTAGVEVLSVVNS